MAAHPSSHLYPVGKDQAGGITMREHVAIAAMQAIIVTSGNVEVTPNVGALVARDALVYADALLAALSADPREPPRERTEVSEGDWDCATGPGTHRSGAAAVSWWEAGSAGEVEADVIGPGGGAPACYFPGRGPVRRPRPRRTRCFRIDRLPRLRRA